MRRLCVVVCLGISAATSMAQAQQRAPIPVVGTPPAATSASPASSTSPSTAPATSSGAKPPTTTPPASWTQGSATTAPTAAGATTGAGPSANSGAAAATIDLVLLRNGELLRGRVVEIVPDHHVAIALENGGATRMLQWREIDRVTLGAPSRGAGGAGAGAAGAGVGAAPVPLVEIPQPAAKVGPTVRLHINSPRKVSLWRKPAQLGTWVEACTSPCDQDLPIGDSYRVQGKGMNTSPEFRIDAAHSTIAVDPSSTSGAILGGVIAGAGAAAGFIGIVMLTSKDTRLGGVVALLLGSGIGLAGFFIYRGAAKTEVNDPNAKPPSETAILGRPSRDVPSAGLQDMPGLSASEARALPSPTFPLFFERAF